MKHGARGQSAMQHLSCVACLGRQGLRMVTAPAHQSRPFCHGERGSDTSRSAPNQFNAADKAMDTSIWRVILFGGLVAAVPLLMALFFPITRRAHFAVVQPLASS